MDFRAAALRAATADLSAWQSSPYYDDAEAQAYVDAFWAPGSAFRRLFDTLDTRATLELAAGHGRNTARMLAEVPVETVIVADPVAANVEYCRGRFSSDERVSVLQLNGVDLDPIGSETLTAVFCYDSMVHFDAMVVISYLLDIRRVLRPGGRALLHHSNLSANPGGPYGANPHARNFMPAGLVDHVAARVGMRVLDRAHVDWGHFRDLDRVTLLEVTEP